MTSDMKAKLRLILPIIVIVLVLDHLTKYWIVANMQIGDSFPVIANIFDIVHVRNKGSAFGFLSDWNSAWRDWFFYGIAVVALVFLYFYIKSVPLADKITLRALAFILGGAAGNVIDRAVRGSVVDFLSVHYHETVWSFTLFGKNYLIPLIWPAFNVADMAISCSVVLLVILNFRAGPKGAEII